MFLRFFPDHAAHARLPAITGNGLPSERADVIQLYRGTLPPADGVFASDYPPALAAPLLQQLFPALPAGFLRYREGQAVSPVQLRLQRLSVFVECDRHRFFATYAAIQARPGEESAASPAQYLRARQTSDCGSRSPDPEHYQAGPAGAVLHQQA